MKRNQRFLIVFLPFLAVLVAFPAAFDCTAVASPIGAVTRVRGSVTVDRPGAAGQPAVRDAAYLAGDVVRTGEDGWAQIGLSDGSFINVAPSSAVRVNQYAFDEAANIRTMRARVLSGLARFVGYRPRNSGSLTFVESGGAVISTGPLADFAVSAATGTVEVVVLGYGVSVRNASSLVVGTVSVGVNQKTAVPEKGPPSPPGIITPAERKRSAFIVR